MKISGNDWLSWHHISQRSAVYKVLMHMFKYSEVIPPEGVGVIRDH